MLDDLKLIHERDSKDALGIAEKQWQQFKYDFKVQAQFSQPIHDVVLAGMGGSGLAAKVFKNWPGLEVPISFVQDYNLPEHVSKHTLLICISYSGNTEETLSVFQQAIDDNTSSEKRPQLAIISSGGKLLEAAQTQNIAHIQLPSGYQPRMTTGYQLRALITILEHTTLLNGTITQLDAAADWLQGKTKSWVPTVPTSQNVAKQIARECIGKSVVIYSGPKFYPAAYKWKISFNENAKHIAWANQYPELNHNEMLGWTKQPVDKPYTMIELRSKLEHPRVQKRFEVTERLLSGLRPAPIVVEAEGETLLEQLLWTIALGDFVSLYTALLNGLDPAPVDLIEKFKKALG